MGTAKQKKCGNPLCKSELSTIDAVCGASIEEEGLECEFVNFLSHKKVCSFEISFELNSSTALIVNSGLRGNEVGFYGEILKVNSVCPTTAVSRRWCAFVSARRHPAASASSSGSMRTTS